MNIHSTGTKRSKHCSNPIDLDLSKIVTVGTCLAFTKDTEASQIHQNHPLRSLASSLCFSDRLQALPLVRQNET